MTDFRRDVEVKARKRHQCSHCLTHVEKGELHLKVSGHFDGAFYHYRSHRCCDDAVNTVCHEFGYNYSDGMPWLHELEEDYLRDIQPNHFMAVGRVYRARELRKQEKRREQDAEEKRREHRDPRQDQGQDNLGGA